MNEDLEHQLKNEIALGDRAEKAYSLYLQSYIDSLYRKYYDDFINTNDIDTVYKIKLQQRAVKDLEQGIFTAIETGKLARAQLNE